MTLPVFAYWALPIGLGITVGIVAAIATHRQEFEDFLEDHALIAAKRVTEVLEAQKAKRKYASTPASESVVKQYATSSNDWKNSDIAVKRKARGFTKKDIDYWLLSQEETGEKEETEEEEATVQGSSTGTSSYVFASPVSKRSYAKAT